MDRLVFVASSLVLCLCSFYDSLGSYAEAFVLFLNTACLLLLKFTFSLSLQITTSILHYFSLEQWFFNPKNKIKQLTLIVEHCNSAGVMTIVLCFCLAKF